MSVSIAFLSSSKLKIMRKRKAVNNFYEAHVISSGFGCGGNKGDKRSSRIFGWKIEDRI